jgi:Fe-S cluster assembly ATP-binding protein
MLEIRNLTVEVDGRRVLNGVDLTVERGETHVLFGPNGSGKTSLVLTILGFPQYKVITGSIRFEGVELIGKSIDERARLGLGVVFQKPPAVRGVRLGDVLRFLGGNCSLLPLLNLPDEFLHRELNVGFSGGEMRRTEILQVLAQKPKLAIFDEPDSGLDVENLETVGRAIDQFLRERSGIIITHMGHILRYVQADFAHVMLNGRIVCSGLPSKILAQILREGYKWCETCPRAFRS